MKILVAVKRVADPYVQVSICADGSGVDLAHVRMVLNPFDETALEEAVRLKEAGVAAEVVAVSIGPGGCKETLRTALAMGAGRAIHVAAEAPPDPLGVAKTLAAVVRAESPALVLMGKQAVDDDCNQVGQMLAALLSWPQVTFASRIRIEGSAATVDREIDAGAETLAVDLPAVVTADLHLNTPRYPSLPSLLKAKKVEIEERTLESLGVNAAPRHRIVRIEPPPERRRGVRVSSAAELVAKLRDVEGIL